MPAPNALRSAITVAQLSKRFVRLLPSGGSGGSGGNGSKGKRSDYQSRNALKRANVPSSGRGCLAQRSGDRELGQPRIELNSRGVKATRIFSTRAR